MHIKVSPLVAFCEVFGSYVNALYRCILITSRKSNNPVSFIFKKISQTPQRNPQKLPYLNNQFKSRPSDHVSSLPFIKNTGIMAQALTHTANRFCPYFVIKPLPFLLSTRSLLFHGIRSMFKNWVNDFFF